MTQPYEKHTPSTDALDTLGSIIGPDEKRDAIHLAVEPAIAGEPLAPGDHVSIDPDTNIAMLAEADSPESVGIVDPFLPREMVKSERYSATWPKRNIQKGERFWLVVYPRQINSLRHVWEHSAFRPSGETDGKPKEPSNRDIAEKWLRDFANNEFDIRDEPNYYGQTFTTFIQAAKNNDGYLTIYGSDASGDIPEVFWDHLELYLGEPVNNKAAHFSCSC